MDSNHRPPAERRVLYPLSYQRNPQPIESAGRRLPPGDQPQFSTAPAVYAEGQTRGGQIQVPCSPGSPSRREVAQ